MVFRLIPSFITLLALNMAVVAAHAQAPELRHLFPSGGQAGGTIEVELVGKQLDAVDRLYLVKPPLPSAVPPLVEARKLAKTRFAIDIPPDTAPGDYDAWALSPQGLSAPCRFVVGALAECLEKEPNPASQSQPVELPVVVNGRLDPAVDADWYRVHLAAGDHLTVSCRSVSLGGAAWPTITVADPQGREVAHDAMTSLEPTVHIRAAVEGDYQVGVQDRSYRTTTAPFYRLTMTTGPWLTTAFPPTLQRGKSQTVTLFGYHLPGGKPLAGTGVQLEQLPVTIAAPEHGPPSGGRWTLSQAVQIDSFSYRHPGIEGEARFELLDRAPLPHPPSATADKNAPEAMLLTPPVDVVGQFASPRRVVDRYRFAAKKGETYWLEAASERIGRPCDLELMVADSTGKSVEIFGNTVTPKGEPTTVPLESRDPAGSWKAPDDGEYQLVVRDLLGTVSNPAERAYRLTIGPRLENVRVVALLGEASAPRGWGVSPGKSLTVPLVAVRRAGHQGAIEVRAEGLPPGLKIAPATIAAKESTGKLDIEAAKDAAPWIGTIRLIATTEQERKPTTFDVQVGAPLAGVSPPAVRLCDSPLVAILGTAAK